MFYDSKRIARAPRANRQIARRFLAAVMAAALAPAGLLNKAQAQAAKICLDRAFDGDGKVITNVGGSSTAWAITRQPDGKIVVAGSSGFAVALARYHKDGSLDEGFGTGGKVVTDISSADGVEFARAVSVLPNGKILVAGGVYNTDYRDAWGVNHTDYYFTLIRYNSDGSLDDGTANDSTPGNSFGTAGKTMIDIPNTSTGARAMAVQPNGKIVLVGSTESGPTPTYDTVLARFNSNGKLDKSFGNRGLLVIDLTGSYDEAEAVVLQPDGKIVVAGTAISTQFWRRGMSLARFNRDGGLDDGSANDLTPGDSFGTDGKVLDDGIGAQTNIYAAALQPDGKIVLGGFTDIDYGYLGVGHHFMLARYDSDGRLDPGFGDHGRVMTKFSNYDVVRAIAIQPDGKIIAGGESDGAFALARYNRDGSPDDGAANDLTPGDSFGINGKLTTSFFRESEDSANAVLIQPDGHILVAGSVRKNPRGSTYAFALARYPGDARCAAPLLERLILSTSSTPVSKTVTGTVTLDAPAPAGGLIVTLASTNAAASVSPQIRIPEGQTGTTFIIQIRPVMTTHSGNIIARLGSITRLAPLVVQPLRVDYISLQQWAGDGPVQH